MAIIKASARLMLTVILPLAIISAQNSSCPEDWLHFQDMCVWVSEAREVFWKAHENCIENGSHLAYINNDAENYFLAGQLFALGRNSVWIGLNDQHVRHIFQWAGKEEPSYANFHDGEPCNRKNHATHNCVAMKLALNYSWSSEYCFEELPYVCRRNF